MLKTDIHGIIVMSATKDAVIIETLVDDTTPRLAPDPGYVPLPEPGPEPSPGRVNINTASLEELQEIIHIGPARAEEIIRLMPFSSVDGLTRVTGIGPARLQDIRDEGKAYVE